jgi:predicted MPP superfamily phosphohydrolase
VLLALVVTLAAWAFWLEPASLVVREDRIELPAFGDRALRVVLLTDLHVGSPFNGLDKLRTVVERTNALRPDLICLLGDYLIQGVRGGTFVPPEPIARELAGLRATAGVFAVLGNHDNWFDGARVAAALRENGIVVLEDAAQKVETAAGAVWMVGFSDLMTARPDIGGALSSVPADATRLIALTHNPDLFPDVPARVTITLAGHTHGGQVRLPLWGSPIVPSQFGERYVAGHVIENGRHLFVATGIGTSILPVRFRVPPTIAVLTLAGPVSSR